MGLLKKIIDDKGIITKYHKIDKVYINKNNILINTKTYADYKFRKKEIDVQQIQNEINILQNKITQLSADYSTNEEQISFKQNEMENLISTLPDNTDFAIGTETYNFKFIDKSYSLADYYDLLKTLDDFANSEDI